MSFRDELYRTADELRGIATEGMRDTPTTTTTVKRYGAGCYHNQCSTGRSH